MPNYRLTLCYDGTRWKGWQKQGNTDHTIQGKLETLLSRLLDQPIEVAASGRTDAGTHAKRQVVSFRAKTALTTQEILDGLRRYLPADIGAVSLEQVEPRFHARFSCTGKTYTYRIWNSDEPNVFERNYLYHLHETLDVPAMRRAAESLLGEHDFLGFAAAGGKTEDTVRTLYEASLLEDGKKLIICLRGSGFLYKMARAIAGTLLAVGEGRLPVEITARILSEKNHALCGETLPACGLTLDRVDYGANE